MEFDPLDIEAVAALADAIPVSTSLQGLSLRFASLGAAEMELLACALKRTSTLTEMDITGNRLDLESITALAEALKVNTSLTEVCVDRPRDAEVVLLALALKANKTLRGLELSWPYRLEEPRLGRAGAEMLLDALHMNCTLSSLTDLKLADDDLVVELWGRIRRLVAKNSEPTLSLQLATTKARQPQRTAFFVGSYGLKTDLQGRTRRVVAAVPMTGCPKHPPDDNFLITVGPIRIPSLESVFCGLGPV